MFGIFVFADVSGNSANDEVKDKPQLISEKLPEGFFDDPKLDAKVLYFYLLHI